MRIDFASRMPASLRARAPRRIAEVNNRIVCDGEFYNDSVIDAHIMEKGNFYELLDSKDGMWDPHVRIAHMDEAGILVSVIFGTIISSGVFGIKDPEIAKHVVAIYHDALAEYCSPYPDRLKGVAVPAIQTGEDEVRRELTRAVVDLGFAGIYFPSNYWGKPVTSPEFRYIFELAADLDVPILLHPSIGALAIDNLGVNRSENFFYRHSMTPPVQMMSAAMYVVTEGLLEELPNLRVAILEGGVGWLPFLIDNLDGHHDLLGYQTKIKKKPSEYFRSGQLYFYADPSDRVLPLAIEMVGEDSFIYASDYWHWDADPLEYAPMLNARTDVTTDQKRKILIDNGNRLFGWQ